MFCWVSYVSLGKRCIKTGHTDKIMLNMICAYTMINVLPVSNSSINKLYQLKKI